MIIQNKKTGIQESVSAEAWAKLERLGFQKGWTVISRDDEPPRKVIPKEIINFRFKETTKTKKHGSKRKPALSDDQAV
jgi:hypothetical protein